jgi:hypothetical protein
MSLQQLCQKSDQLAFEMGGLREFQPHVLRFRDEFDCHCSLLRLPEHFCCILYSC